MKRNFLLHKLKIYCYKYTIPKFQGSAIKIVRFTSVQSLLFLLQKCLEVWVRNYCEIPASDVSLFAKDCLRLLIFSHVSEIFTNLMVSYESEKFSNILNRVGFRNNSIALKKKTFWRKKGKIVK